MGEYQQDPLQLEFIDRLVEVDLPDFQREFLPRPPAHLMPSEDHINAMSKAFQFLTLPNCPLVILDERPGFRSEDFLRAERFVSCLFLSVDDA